MNVRHTATAWTAIGLFLMGAAQGAKPDKVDAPLFLIGSPDGSTAEFGLVTQGYAAFTKVFADPVVYTVGKSKPVDWPFVHPAHRDKWAGGQAHTFQIRFHNKAVPQQKLFLTLGVVAAHSTERSRVTVTVNETPLAEQVAPATGHMEVVFDPTTPGASDRMLFEVPAGLIAEGDNSISIRLDDQSWILYDYVALSTSKKPLPKVEPPEPKLLEEFLAGPMAGVEDVVFALRQPGKDGHWYANFGYYADDDQRLLYGDGGRLVRMNLRSGKQTALLDDPAGGVRDPVVHYDARKILFSYRPGGTANYHLYEINVDGTGLVQLTDGPFDDIEPTYLPDGGVMFVSSRCKRWVNCWLTHVAVLHRGELTPDGRPLEDIRPISANIEHDNTPWVLPDGRVLYQRWEYVDRSQVDYHHLWTTNPDGSGQMVYYGNMHPATVMIDAKPIPRGKKVVAIFSPGHGRREHDGALVVLDPSGGPDDTELARYVSREAVFRDPWAFSEGAFMAARGNQIVLVDGRGRSQTIYRLSKEDVAAGLACHEPRPIVARPRERVIPPRTEPRKSTGRLALMNVYQGRNMDGVQPGEIKKLLVLESLPKPINFTGGMDPLTYGGSFTLERVLGTVPVEEDGSAYMELPALRSFFFVALDENDLAVKRMQSFLTVQPGEVTGCIGCHEQRTQSFIPDSNVAAMRRPPSRVEPIADCPDVFDFVRDVQPVLDRLCVDCHDYEKTERGGPYAGGVVLSGDHGPMFSHSYFTLTVRQLFSDGRDKAVSNYSPRTLGSSASRILQMIDGSHYGAVASEHEARMLRLWIEVGAPYPGTYAALGSGSIGGYAQNKLVNTDTDWPTTKAGAEVLARRCAGCHRDSDVLPKSMSDERGVSFWRFDPSDARLRLARHIVFNLSRPERSLLVLAPLAESAGGFGLCETEEGQPAPVFADASDSDYQTLVAMAAAGRDNLDEIKRFDMPGFRPRPQYVREMKRFGILPPDHPPDSEIDCYATDQAYWQSLWYEGTSLGAE